MKENHKLNVGTGASSILMIFVVLCLTTFGILSLVSSRADLHLTQANARSVEEYYLADSKLELELSDLDSALLRAGATAEDYLSQDAYLNSDLAGAQDENEVYWYFARQYVKEALGDAVSVSDRQAELIVPVNDAQQIHATVEFGNYQDSARYTVTARKTESTQTWEEGMENGGSLGLWIPDSNDQT